MELVTKAKIYSMSLSNDKRKILLSLHDNQIEIYDLDTFSRIGTIRSIKGYAYNVVLTTDNRFLIFSNKNQIVNVWDCELKKIILELPGHKSEITSVKVSPNNSKIITASEDTSIKVWDFSGDLLYSLDGHHAGITVIAISFNNKFLISGSEDYDIKIWDLTSGKLIKTLEDHEYSINSISIAPSNKFFASSSKEKTLVWDLRTKSILKTFETYSKPLELLAISSNERFLLGASEEHVLCYNLNTNLIESMQEIKNKPFLLDFNYNSQYLIGGFKPNIIQKYDFLKWLEENKFDSRKKFGILHIPFRAYVGKDPYIFVSYAHLDKEVVYNEIQWIKNNNFNIWYDEGIPPTTEWPEEIENAIKKCTLFIVFITPNSVERKNVRNEINYALKKKKKFLAIYLVPTELKFGLELLLGSTQAIMKYDHNQKIYIEKVLETLRNIFDIYKKWK